MLGPAGPKESNGVADAADPEGTVIGADETGAVLAVAGTAEDEEDEEADTAALKLERRAATDLAFLTRAELAAPPPRFLTGLLRTLECN